MDREEEEARDPDTRSKTLWPIWSWPNLSGRAAGMIASHSGLAPTPPTVRNGWDLLGAARVRGVGQVCSRILLTRSPE